MTTTRKLTDLTINKLNGYSVTKFKLYLRFYEIRMSITVNGIEIDRSLYFHTDKFDHVITVYDNKVYIDTKIDHNHKSMFDMRADLEELHIIKSNDAQLLLISEMMAIVIISKIKSINEFYQSKHNNISYEQFLREHINI